jgi:hypothetical protein
LRSKLGVVVFALVATPNIMIPTCEGYLHNYNWDGLAVLCTYS